MLTVEDFREKGAVGAVKDAVADAGDILIDGVAGLIGWIRGDPPVEEESTASEEASKVLANGPSGAAYGISQASPTGGINAVWVMPDEADPATLAQLAAQAQPGWASQMTDPRVPKNIQPYEPPQGRRGGSSLSMQYMPSALSMPGGPVIAPYEPAPSGPSSRIPPYMPSAGTRAAAPPVNPWGPGGYNVPSGSAASASSSSSAPASGAKAFVERIARGDVLVGPDVAKRLVSQCQAANTSGKQLAEMVCESARRLYLGLDGGDPVEADAALARLLGLVDALAQQSGEIAKIAVADVRKAASEELLSLRSCAKHKDAAEPILLRLGFVAGVPAAAAAAVDLLGGEESEVAKPAPLLASRSSVQEDLLGGAEEAPTAVAEARRPAAAPTEDLIGDAAPVADAPAAARAAAPLESLLFDATPGASLLGDLEPSIAAVPVPAASTGSETGATTKSPAKDGTLGAGATLQEKKDIFGFVGAEMSKAGSKIV